MMCLCGAIEVCLSQWGSAVLRDHNGMSSGAAAGAVAATIGGMFLGRLMGGRLALRFSPTALIAGSFAVALLGFSFFWISSKPWLSVAGLLIAGLGMAVHYPMGTALAIAASAGQSDRAMSLTAYAMGLSFGIVTFILAPLADLVGNHKAFLLVPLLLLMAAVCLKQTQLRLDASMTEERSPEPERQHNPSRIQGSQ